MSELKELEKKVYKHDKEIALHDQVLSRLVDNESAMTKLLNAMHESNSSLKLISKDVNDCQNSIGELNQKVSNLEKWQHNVEGAQKSTSWLMRHSGTIGKIILSVVIVIMVTEGYLLNAK